MRRRLPVVAAPARYAVAGLGEDAAFAVFGDGDYAGAGECGYALRGNVAGDEGGASGSENADVVSPAYPQPALMVPVDDLQGFAGYSLLLTEDFDLIVFYAAELLRAAEPERAVVIDEDVVQMGELRVCGCLPGVEVGSDGPTLRAVCGLGEHQGVAIQEEDVPGIDGGEALAGAELYGT